MINGSLNIQILNKNEELVSERNVKNTVSNVFKNEILNLITASGFFNNSGTTSSSANMNAVTSLKENGFIIGHKNIYDAINNSVAVVSAASSNSFSNSSTFFDDITRRAYRTGDDVYFEQSIKNTSFDSQQFVAFSLIKNPIQYKSILINGQFENTTLTGTTNTTNAITCLTVPASNIYGISNTLKLITTTASGNINFTAVGGQAFTTLSALSGTYEISYSWKCDNANRYGRFRFRNSAGTVTHYDNETYNVPTAWTSYTIPSIYTGTGNNNNIITLTSPTGVGEYIYFDNIRLRPYPLFTQGGQLAGSQISYMILKEPINLQPDEVIKITWKLAFSIANDINKNNNGR